VNFYSGGLSVLHATFYKSTMSCRHPAFRLKKPDLPQFWWLWFSLEIGGEENTHQA